ncbi:hypothetical protein ILYODFUR_034829 [Ilyodon furcidens]|uniref:Uncharacterized protein n=1 Tax=Ilyodon furcidens TaxID=33524 RepID=A0ABV0TF07_9TELE
MESRLTSEVKVSGGRAVMERNKPPGFPGTGEAGHRKLYRGYKGAADNRTPNSVCAEAMSLRYTAEDAVELIFSDVQQDNSDSEEEAEDVSEEEDGEEYNPEHDESSSEEEENPEAERETFLSKNGKITWSSASYDQHKTS